MITWLILLPIELPRRPLILGHFKSIRKILVKRVFCDKEALQLVNSQPIAWFDSLQLILFMDFFDKLSNDLTVNHS